jgi:hypothetical protein
MTDIAVTPVSDEELQFTATLPAGAAELSLVLLDAQGAEVGSAADVVSVVATPTAPVIFDVWPREVYANSPTFFTVYGWLLDPADCIGLDSENGSTNWSGLDFTNTGIVIPWESTLGKGTWNWHAKQGGSGGTIIASKTAAVVAKPTELVSVVPNTALPGVATTYVITLTGAGLYVGRVVLVDAAGVEQPPIDLPTDASQNTATTVTFTATLPLGVYDAELWFWPTATNQLIATLPDVITVEDPG